MSNSLEYLWYKLSCAEGFGPKSIFAIVDSGLSLNTVFDMDVDEFIKTFPKLGKLKYDSLHNLDEEIALSAFQKLKQENIELIYAGHSLYPVKLLYYKDLGIPPLLFCQGYLPLLKADSVAIVGSRNASEEGLFLAQHYASELALQGKNIISGYARGIDTYAHLGAMEKDGTTTIILSFGILEFSPKRVYSHLKLKGNVLLISQFPPTEKWNAGSAMIRNKLVGALSNAVIVIEAGLEKDSNGKMSGTFAAGKMALQMKIPLFVVSPSYFKNPPLGNLDLIKLGGIEISAENDITSLLKQCQNRDEIAVFDKKPQLQISLKLGELS